MGGSRPPPAGPDPWPCSRLAGAMPAGGRALLALGLLTLGCAAAARPPSAADNDFPEGGPERRRPPVPAPACPRDCGCSQEGVVDCGGIDLKEFPLLLPELTNHLSLQVREPGPAPPRPPEGSPRAAQAPVPALAWARLRPASRRRSRPSTRPPPTRPVIGVGALPYRPREEER